MEVPSDTKPDLDYFDAKEGVSFCEYLTADLNIGMCKNAILTSCSCNFGFET